MQPRNARALSLFCLLPPPTVLARRHPGLKTTTLERGRELPKFSAREPNATPSYKPLALR